MFHVNPVSHFDDRFIELISGLILLTVRVEYSYFDGFSKLLSNEFFLRRLVLIRLSIGTYVNSSLPDPSSV